MKGKNCINIVFYLQIHSFYIIFTNKYLKGKKHADKLISTFAAAYLAGYPVLKLFRNEGLGLAFVTPITEAVPRPPRPPPPLFLSLNSCPSHTGRGNSAQGQSTVTKTERAREFCRASVALDLFYSRKNFKRPDLQVTPHRTFEEEADSLDRAFPGKGGRAYCLGSLNGEDCWYLYTVSPGTARSELISRHNLPHSRAGKHRSSEPDQTLEVLMTDVDPEKMLYFYKENYPCAGEATKASGIEALIPGMTIDDFQFEPCGYSMNGVSRTVPGGYMTIHITPEPGFSYVSFETNVPHKNYKDLIDRVVQIFGPKQFVVTFFSTEPAKSGLGFDDADSPVCDGDNYYVEDIQICRLPGYDLTYALYNRYPS